MNKIEIFNLIAIIFGATGFWKLIELFLRYRQDRNKKNVEIENLQTQTNNLMLDNWIEWSAKLENRVKELESALEKMANEDEKKKNIISEQSEMIIQLENKVLQLEKQKEELSKKLKSC